MFSIVNTPWFRRLACWILLVTLLPGTLWLLFTAQDVQVLCATLIGALLGYHLEPALHHCGDGLLLMILGARLIEMATPGDHVRQLLDQDLVPLMAIVLWPTGPGRWLKSAYTWLVRNSRRWSNGVPIHSSSTSLIWNETL